jgi:flagellar hook-basal body complex protein FliE
MIVRPIQTAESAAASSIDGSSFASPLGNSPSPAPADSFTAVLSGALQQANQLDLNASRKVEALATGAIDDIHGTMISVKEADIALKLVGTVRTKILDAFQELWRTSV